MLDALAHWLVGLASGLARPCFASTIALRRETLRLIGGFDASRSSPTITRRHELRGARTLRAVNPWRYVGEVITNPLPLALLGAGLSGFALPGSACIAAAMACRLVLQLQVEHTLRLRTSRWWLGRVHDLLAFGVGVASFFVDIASWRSRRFKVRADGTLVPVVESKA